MSIVAKVSILNDLVQASFRNGMDAVENIHQISAEIPIEILKELGYPEDTAEIIKESHRRILSIVYGGICSANQDLGDLVVRQAGELSRLADGLKRTIDSYPADGTEVRGKSTPAIKVVELINPPADTRQKAQS